MPSTPADLWPAIPILHSEGLVATQVSPFHVLHLDDFLGLPFLSFQRAGPYLAHASDLFQGKLSGHSLGTLLVSACCTTELCWSSLLSVPWEWPWTMVAGLALSRDLPGPLQLWHLLLALWWLCVGSSAIVGFGLGKSWGETEWTGGKTVMGSTSETDQVLLALLAQQVSV